MRGALHLGSLDLSAPDAKPFHARRSGLACIWEPDGRGLTSSRLNCREARSELCFAPPERWEDDAGPTQ